jgi:biotin carboxylase
MSQKYLVILGGNLMACPAIRRLQEHGHKILVVDGNANSPAKMVADLFIHQDFSDVKATIGRLVDIDISGAMPLNDFAISSAASISRERGLPGWSEFSEHCVRSKVAMKKAWQAAGLPTARTKFSTIQDLLLGHHPKWDHWPCVIKPAFSGGGSRGVFVAQNWQQARVQLEKLQAKYLDGDVLIEEFISGTEHTLEVLVCKGVPHLLSISDKENYKGSNTIVQNLYFPGPIGNMHRSVLEPLVYAACRAMRLTDGTAHFEVLLREGKGYLLEVGGRPGGGINFHPICELSTGYDYPSLLGAVLTGQEPNFRRTHSVHLAWHYFLPGEGILHSVDGFEAVKQELDVVDAALYEKVGEPRFDLSDDLARPGYVLVKANSHERAKARAAKIIQQIKFNSHNDEG